MTLACLESIKLVKRGTVQDDAAELENFFQKLGEPTWSEIR